MGVENCYEGLDEYAVRIIKRKAKQLAGRSGFNESDRHDIEQELALHVWRRLPMEDPTRSSRHTFVARIIDNYVKNLIAGRKAAIRDWRCTAFSLDEEVEQENGTRFSRGDLIDQEVVLAATGKVRRDRDLAVDMQRVWDTLSAEHRDICLRLASATVAEVAAAMGKPRTSLYEDIKKLRSLLEASGLREYL
jgi:RNA polymerase sigma-70 factor (ECF subfamily)